MINLVPGLIQADLIKLGWGKYGVNDFFLSFSKKNTLFCNAIKKSATNKSTLKKKCDHNSDKQNVLLNYIINR